MHGGIGENGVAKIELFCGYFTLLSINECGTLFAVDAKFA
jgi:hypothetical protein